jgi:hypothetical protein
MDCTSLSKIQTDYEKVKILWEKWYNENYYEWRTIMNSDNSKKELNTYLYSSKSGVKLFKKIYENALKLHLCEIKTMKKIHEISKKKNAVEANQEKKPSKFDQFLGLFRAKKSNSNNVLQTKKSRNNYTNQPKQTKNNQELQIKELVEKELYKERKKLKKIKQEFINSKEAEIERSKKAERNKLNSNAKEKAKVKAEAERLKFVAAEISRDKERSRAEDEYIRAKAKAKAKAKAIAEAEAEAEAIRVKAEAIRVKAEANRVKAEASISRSKHSRNEAILHSRRYSDCNKNDIDCICESKHKSYRNIEQCKEETCRQYRYSSGECSTGSYGCENYIKAACTKHNCDDKSNCYYCRNYYDPWCDTVNGYKNKFRITFNTSRHTFYREKQQNIARQADIYIYFISKLLGENYFPNSSCDGCMTFNSKNNQITIEIESDNSEQSIRSIFNKRIGIDVKPYKLDTVNKQIHRSDFATLTLNSIASIESIANSTVQSTTSSSGNKLHDKQVQIQFVGAQGIDRVGLVNKHKENYDTEINDLLRKVTNSNIKSITITKCEKIDTNKDKANLKLNITFNSSDDTLKVLSGLKTTDKKGIKPCNECPTFIFIVENQTLRNTLKSLKGSNTKYLQSIFTELEKKPKGELASFNLNHLDLHVGTKPFVDALKLVDTINLSHETLRNILRYNIFQLRKKDEAKLHQSLEEFRHMALIKLSVVNYKMIDTFMKKYKLQNITSIDLVKHYADRDFTVISRSELVEIVDPFYFLQNRSNIITELLTRVKSNTDNNKNKNILLFLIFGDYGIQPAITLDQSLSV